MGLLNDSFKAANLSICASCAFLWPPSLQWLTDVWDKPRLHKFCVISPLLFGIWFVAVTGALGTDGHNPHVVILNYRWYQSASNVGHAGCFSTEHEGVSEANREGMPCPKYEADSQIIVQVPHENANQERSRLGLDYVYELRIRNVGNKAIKAISWDYVFAEPKSGTELARHTFFNEIRLLPGRNRTLIAFSPKPPTRVITAEMLTNSGSYKEQIEIRQIVYSDGSAWTLQ